MKIKLLFLSLALIINASQGFCQDSGKRAYIYMVGSSTVSPLMAAVSEEFSRVQSEKKTPILTPVVKSTGTRNGFHFFCSGIGSEYPDFVNASRAITFDEIKFCNSNKIKDIIEIKIGYDGIVFGNFKTDAKIKFTTEEIFLALAEKIIDQKNGKLIDNPYETWNQINPNLPNHKITIYGPPLSSGTRDVFVDMVMESTCLAQKEFVAAFSDETKLKQQCHKIRNDGKFIESGENDDLIIKNLKNNHNAFGIFGFNFMVINHEIQSAEIDGVYPNQQTIASKKYPLSRPLFVYFKKEHLGIVPKIPEFINEIISPETIGSKGYLVNTGLVALDKNELKILRKNILLKLKK